MRGSSLLVTLMTCLMAWRFARQRGRWQSRRPYSSPSPANGASFDGEWDTKSESATYRMTLTQDAAGNVTGEYMPAGSNTHHKIPKGAVVGNELIAQWIQGNQTGVAVFTMLPGQKRFDGNWASGAVMPTPPTNPWTGTRVSAVPAMAARMVCQGGGGMTFRPEGVGNFVYFAAAPQGANFAPPEPNSLRVD